MCAYLFFCVFSLFSLSESFLTRVQRNKKTRLIKQYNFDKENEDEKKMRENNYKRFMSQVPSGSTSRKKQHRYTIYLEEDPEEDPEENASQVKQRESTNFCVEYDQELNFTNVAGYENIKHEIAQCSDMLLNYEKYKKYSVRMPKGMVLHGPPGNGKTLIAKSFCGEIKVPFIAVSGSQFQEKYVGVGSSRVRELFDLAEANAPCVIFIDEVDAIGRRRSSGDDNSQSERENTLNELLVQLDGFKSKKGIFLILATNRVDLLDPALMRPGRVDKNIFIGNPDANTRFKIIDLYLKGKPHSNVISRQSLVEMTSGMSCASIENLLNEAMLNALRDNRENIEIDDLEIVNMKIIGGYQEFQVNYSLVIINKIAIHEIGHAIAGVIQKKHPRLLKIQLNFKSPTIPGYTIFENNEAHLYSREELFSRVVVLLSGCNAERLFFNESGVTQGCSNDLAVAHRLVIDMVLNFGMGGKRIYPILSERYKESIDKDVDNILCEANNESLKIINQYKKEIRELSLLLIDKKTLTRDFIDFYLQKKQNGTK
jgi:cell division protease FtsH